MIEEFKDRKGAYISDGRISMEFQDYEIRDLFIELENLIVQWDKSKSISNKDLLAYSDFQGHILIRIGEEEFGLNTLKAVKFLRDLKKAIDDSL